MEDTPNAALANNVSRHHHALLSRLESLPTELIRKIFLLSLEINMPRASTALGAALADPLIYKGLLRSYLVGHTYAERYIMASPEDVLRDFRLSAWPGKEIDRELCFRADRADRERQRDRAAQGEEEYSQERHGRELAETTTKMLACRWCTFPLIRSMQREFILFVVRRVWIDVGMEMTESAEREKLGLLFQDEFWTPYPSHPINPNEAVPKRWDIEIEGRHPDDSEWPEFRRKALRINFHIGMVTIGVAAKIRGAGLPDNYCWPSMSAFVPVIIPYNKLLDTPSSSVWTDSTFDALHLFHRAFVELTPPDMPVETKKALKSSWLRRAIRERDFRMVDLLVRWYKSMGTEERRRRNNVDVDDEHWELAATVGDRDVIRMLCRDTTSFAKQGQMRAERLPTLKAWADKGWAERKDRFCEWLAAKMDGYEGGWLDEWHSSVWGYIKHA